MTIAQVLNELGITEYVLRSEPTNESEFNQYFYKIVGETENGHAIESNNPDDFDVTWEQIQSKIAELEAAEPLRLLRIERDRKLTEVDWWTSRALDGTPLTTEQTAYRQALRDLPENSANVAIDENGTLINVEWPVKPE